MFLLETEKLLEAIKTSTWKKIAYSSPFSHFRII